MEADSILDRVVYLYASEEDAKNGEKSGGSKFLVSIPSAIDPRRFYLYIVTNRHVIDVATTVRMKTAEGEIVILNSRRDQWVDHPDGDDVAACEVVRVEWDTIGLAKDKVVIMV
jgi:S1-C subfamily serine protease